MTLTGLSRPLALALAAASLCAAGTSAPAQGVDLKPFRKELKQPFTGTDRSKLADLKNGKLRTGGTDLKVNQNLLDRAAKSFVYLATQDQFYLGGDTGELRPRPSDQVFDYVVSDLASFVVVPGGTERITLDQAEYTREFGTALDRAFREVLTPTLPPVMRVNVGRLLAVACRSGAPAHAKMVTDLLNGKYFKGVGGKDMETPPEVLLYAMKAAEGLLAAYDPYSPNVGPTAGRHTLKDTDLVPLVQALITLVEKNPPVKDKAATLNPDVPPEARTIPPDKEKDGKTPPAAAEPKKEQPKADPNALTPEQIDLIRFFRRAAVRALAKVRFDTLGGEGDVPEVRPGYTLARVAVADVAINPAPSHTEVAEAVIGLCGINPSPPLQVDELGVVIAYGVTLFVRAKPVEDNMRSEGGKPATPWRAYGARLGAAANYLKRNTQQNARLKGFQQPLSQLADYIVQDVANPLDVPVEKSVEGVQPKLDQLYRWMEQNPPKDKGRSFYNGAPRYTFSPRPAGG